MNDSHRRDARPTSRMPRALLVDPDEDTRSMYGAYLTSRAFAVDEAADGRMALAKAVTERPDVIVTEIGIAGFDGYELCRLVRRDHGTRTIPIIVITSDHEPQQIDRARAAGADAVLTKPCLPETLLSEILRLVEGQTSQDRRPETGRRRMAVASPRQRPSSRTVHRYETTEPPHPPPALVCRRCDHPLVYERSHIGGVSERQIEQWDLFRCPNGCGLFQYRHRTRKLKAVV